MQLIHDGHTIIARLTDSAVIQGTPHTVYRGSESECAEESARLGLIEHPRPGSVRQPVDTTIRDRMRAWLAALPQEVRDGFAPVIQVLTPLIESGKYAEAALGLAALSVPDALSAAKSEGLSILRGL